MKNSVIKKIVYVSVIVLFAANIFVWRAVSFEQNHKNLEMNFLDVGQGDSELIIFPGNVKVLIDGGPDANVLNGLAKILGPIDRRIDIVVLTHPHLDHYGGLIDVFKNYQVGAFIDSGKTASISAYLEFEKALKGNGAQHIVLAEGDKVKYGDVRLDILSPGKSDLRSDVVHDSCVVLRLISGNLRALFVGDAGQDIEDELIGKYDISAQILKVGHHGSKTSSSPEFLKAVHPLVSVIEVGRRNTYHHPTPTALNNLANIGSRIFRTDKDGNIKIVFDGQELKVFD